MGIQNITGLAALAFIPVIIILYMLRPKNKPVILPSLYLWKYAIDEIEAASRFKKLKSSLLMFLQILAIVLIALILAGLFIKGEGKKGNVIIVMDCSVTMASKDLEPTRLEYAKLMAKDYLKGLDKEATVSIIALKEVPEIILTKEKERGIATALIEQLTTTATLADFEWVHQTIATLKGNEETTIAYFGDGSLQGADNFVVRNSDDNMSVYDVVYTKYEDQKTISVLTEVFNHSSKSERVPISIYIDNTFFDAKLVDIETKSSTKVFFDNLPMDAKELKITIDREDILPVDNIAYGVVGEESIKKVVLVSTGNIFLEKVLRLDSSIELYKANIENSNNLHGFDLYVYDAYMPEVLPKDGALLLFDPEDNAYFTSLGYVKQPVFESSEHPIMNNIYRPEFQAAMTRTYAIEGEYEPILTTEFGTSAFAGKINGQSLAVFGFDLHYTDLPLSVEFPILMMNILDYLLPKSMLSERSVEAGGAIELLISPQTTKATIEGPLGNRYSLPLSKQEHLFSHTYTTGVYTYTQEGLQRKYSEQFAVNVKKPSSESIFGEDKNVGNQPLATTKSLTKIIGILLVCVLIVEWFIYSYRRRVHAYKH